MKFRIISTFVAVVAIKSLSYASIVTYPAPDGAKLNKSFTLEVSENGTGWHHVDIYEVKVAEVVDAQNRTRHSSMAYFDCDSEVMVRIISNKRKVSEACVRPMNLAITPAVNGDTISFSVKPPKLMSIEVNGDIFDNLQLFVNPMDTNRPTKKELKRLAKSKDYIYFAPGRHKIDTLMVKSNQTVYVAGGAVVDGVIHVADARNVKVLGRGMVYPNNKVAVRVSRSSNVDIEGLFTTQCAVGGSHDIRVKNVKVMSWYGWGDGFNVFASSDVSYDGCFARTSDDCTTIYCTRLGYFGSCRNIKMENSVLWADVAHPIQIGLHGSFDVSKPDSIVGALYRNIDILDMNEIQIDYQGAFAITCGDNNRIRNITFENIRVDNFRRGKLFDLRICNNKKYCRFPGQEISDITFKDIVYNGDRSELSLIIGFNEERKVKNVTFDNLVINGLKIYDAMPRKPKWYKTADFARIFIGENVDNVVFK